jgi:tetratricopeptide (TPR) repeat protein
LIDVTSYPISCSLNNWAISLKLPISIGTIVVIILVYLISFFSPSVASATRATPEESIRSVLESIISDIEALKNLLEGDRVPVYQVIELANRIGNGLNAIGRYQEAIKFFDMVIIASPATHSKDLIIIKGLRDALQGKGTALFGLGSYQEAIEQYDKALALRGFPIPRFFGLYITTRV